MAEVQLGWFEETETRAEKWGYYARERAREIHEVRKIF